MDFNTTENITDCSSLLNPSNPLRNPFFQGTVYSMYAIIFLVALMGNSFICYVIITSPRMQTVTNYFIMNLTTSDILITVLCIPFTSVAQIKQYWPFGEVLCPIVNYSQAVSVFLSAYTLVAISIDKYMVIMWPLKPRITKRFSITIIAIIWLVAATTVLPIALFSNTIQPPQTHHEKCGRTPKPNHLHFPELTTRFSPVQPTKQLLKQTKSIAYWVTWVGITTENQYTLIRGTDSVATPSTLAELSQGLSAGLVQPTKQLLKQTKSIAYWVTWVGITTENQYTLIRGTDSVATPSTLAELSQGLSAGLGQLAN
ncbi:hypothetical protein JTB14_038151 [Gonioctena quinquepunctata]|nr:hypothetical protein JTB14_038151 [Gonioctena quinquepunctata]